MSLSKVFETLRDLSNPFNFLASQLRKVSLMLEVLPFCTSLARAYGVQANPSGAKEGFQITIVLLRLVTHYSLLTPVGNVKKSPYSEQPDATARKIASSLKSKANRTLSNKTSRRNCQSSFRWSISENTIFHHLYCGKLVIESETQVQIFDKAYFLSLTPSSMLV